MVYDFEENLVEKWSTISEFPMYQVSNLGEVRNQDSGKILRQSMNQYGLTKVGIYYDGIRTSRSVALLVADAFVLGRDDHMNTPIHLNNDHTDNRAVNLVWRPRSFAWEYTHQFDRPRTLFTSKPIYDLTNGVWYADAYEAAMINGLLIREILYTMHHAEWNHCFPTGQQFLFRDE